VAPAAFFQFLLFQGYFQIPQTLLEIPAGMQGVVGVVKNQVFQVRRLPADFIDPVEKGVQARGSHLMDGGIVINQQGALFLPETDPVDDQIGLPVHPFIDGPQMAKIGDFLRSDQPYRSGEKRGCLEQGDVLIPSGQILLMFVGEPPTWSVVV
jgi:hypothetical protein